MNTIHPSASISKNVQLGEDNEIGPGCVIEGPSALGSHNKLWMHVYVGPGTTVGDHNQIHMGAVIGHVPQDAAFTSCASSTTVGSHNTIREYVTIHRGAKEGTATVLGDHNFLMANAHIAHNCQVRNRVVLVNLATLAGYCVLEDGAFLSGLAALHQFTRVGRLAMVSGLSAVNKDVPPYMLCAGHMAVIQGINVVGLRRAGVSAPVRQEIKHAYRLLYRSGLNVPHALEAIERECHSEEVQYLVAFVRASERGICAGLSACAGGEEPTLPRKTIRAPLSDPEGLASEETA